MEILCYQDTHENIPVNLPNETKIDKDLKQIQIVANVRIIKNLDFLILQGEPNAISHASYLIDQAIEMVKKLMLL